MGVTPPSSERPLKLVRDPIRQIRQIREPRMPVSPRLALLNNTGSAPASRNAAKCRRNRRPVYPPCPFVPLAVIPLRTDHFLRAHLKANSPGQKISPRTAAPPAPRHTACTSPSPGSKFFARNANAPPVRLRMRPPAACDLSVRSYHRLEMPAAVIDTVAPFSAGNPHPPSRPHAVAHHISPSA